jgi:CheY-like chemotaxis protein
MERRILIVDDNADAAESLAMLLRDMGHRAEVALSGDAALAAVRRAPPDVIFLDLVLGDIEGWELARLIRQEPGMQSTRILALTAYGSEFDRLRSLEAGCEAHLLKPVAPRVLERLLA